MNDFEYVDVGGDRFRAELIVRACRSEGLRVQFLGGDDDLYHTEQHRLLIRSEDRDRVLAVISRS